MRSRRAVQKAFQSGKRLDFATPKPLLDDTHTKYKILHCYNDRRVHKLYIMNLTYVYLFNQRLPQLKVRFKHLFNQMWLDLIYFSFGRTYMCSLDTQKTLLFEVGGSRLWVQSRQERLTKLLSVCVCVLLSHRVVRQGVSGVFL